MDIAQSRPRFRTDLVSQPIEDGGQRFVDVTDPDSGKTFRFYEVEYSIACAMDGQRDLSGLASWAEEELGITPKPSTNELQRVVNTLADLGYLSESSDSGLAAIALGHAGASDDADAQGMPEIANVELGHAGNVGFGASGSSIPSAPDIGLGEAGATLQSASPLVSDAPSLQLGVAGSSSVDEMMDNEPTSVHQRAVAQGPEAIDLPPPPAPGDQSKPVPVLTPSTDADSDEDGPTALPPPVSDFDEEVSVDLTDHLKLGPDALKEAVRQSQMIATPDEPVIQLDSPPADEPPARPITQPPETAKPVELPDKKPPVRVTKPLDATPETKGKPSEPKTRVGLLLVILLIVVLGGAVAVYMLDIGGLKTKLFGGDDKPPPKEQKDPKPKPPPKPEPPTAKLASVEVPAVEVKAADDGQISTIKESGTEVQADEIVITLKGAERIEKKLAAVLSRQEYYQRKLDAAVDANNEKDIKKNTAKVEEKKATAAKHREALAAFAIKAPSAGPIETSLAANARIKAGDVVFTIKQPATLQATFTLPKGKTLKADDEVEVVGKADDKKQLGCKVLKVEADKATVECPSGDKLAADAEVILRD